ncbi:MAG: hypothetical protein K8J09_05780 [Planctomycetes bacterium]|nr:hypothetical protein [Planctomycetota bacterium]MCC7397903.1 hypothetical protein [Planctomycetota bacterium]
MRRDPPPGELARWSRHVRYVGNPDHKRNPGDFGLEPPSSPRVDKTLCDGAEIFTLREAQRLLRIGVERGLVSEQLRRGWPQNIWSVAKNGTPLEAMLDNQARGTYHGYPMLADDPLAKIVLERWG